MRSKTSTVIAGAVIISAGMLISRLLGLARENLLLGTFGDSDISGAYNMAFVVPDLFYNLLAGGAMSAAFIPVFTSYLSKDKHKEAHETGSTIATFLLLSMTICSLLIIVFAPQLVGLLQLLQPPEHRLSAESIRLTVSLTRIMCVMLLFTAQSGHLTGILNSFKHFVTPVAVWSVYNLVIMLGITTFSKMPLFGGSPKHPNIHGVAYSVVLGAILLAAIQFPVAIKYGFRFKWKLDFKHEGVRNVLRLFLPVMISLALSQINLMLLPLILGSRFGFPAVTDIRAANRLVLLPLGLFAIAISTAAFPQMAQQAAMGEKSEFRKTLAQSMKVIVLLSIPSIVGLFVLAEPITYLLWGGGKFGMQGIQASSFVLMFFSWGLLGLGLVQIVNRAFYAMHDSRTPTIVGIAMVVASFFLALYMAKREDWGFKYGSVALATTITSTISTLVLMELLRRRMGGFGGRSITIVTLKALVASAVMGIILYYTATWMAPTFGKVALVPAFRWPAPPVPFSRDLATTTSIHLSKVLKLHLGLQVGGSIFLGILAYFGILKMLGVEEINIISNRLLGKLRIGARREATL